MKYTENLHLNKPGADNYFSVEHMNENMDKLDENISKNKNDLSDHTSDLNNPHNVTPEQLGIPDTYATKEEVDSLEIGGRNLIVGTKDFSGSLWNTNKDNSVQDGTYKGFSVMKQSANGNGQWGGIGQLCNLDLGEKYTLSAYVKTEGDVIFYGMADIPSGGLKIVTEPLVDFERISITFTASDKYGTTQVCRFENSIAGKYLWICGMKLEKGDKATDWSLAPEDILKSDTLYSQTLGYTKKNLYDNTNNFVASAYSGVTIASNGDGTFNVSGTATGNVNVIQKTFSLKKGKYIASLKETSRYIAYRIYNRTTSTFIGSDIAIGEVEFDVTVDSHVYDIRIQVSSGSTANTTNQAIMIRSADILDGTYEPYVEDVDSRLVELENLEIGGRNLYLGTKDFSGNNWLNSNYWIDNGTYKGFQVKKSNSEWQGLSQEVDVVAGEIYTFSAYVKCANICKITTTLYDQPKISTPYSAEVYEGTGEWERVSLTVKIHTSGKIYFRVESAVVGAEVCGLKLEKGEKATDWTPAPEDVDSRLVACEDNAFMPRDEVIPVGELDTFKNRPSGTYIVSETGSQKQLTVFKNKHASASALEFYHSFNLSQFKVRSTIDSNRYSEWKEISFNGHTHDYLPLTGGEVTGATKIDGVTTRKVSIPNANGYPSYILMFDVTTWYNSTTLDQAKRGFTGQVISQRTGGYMYDHVASIYMGVAYKKVTKEDANNLCLRTTHASYQPCIIFDSVNEKYYLALKVTGSNRDLHFQGIYVGTYVGTIIQSTDSNGTLPSGYTVAISGCVMVPVDRARADSDGNTINATYIKKSNVANNLTTTSSGMVLDATQGKALNDRIASIGKKTGTWTPTYSGTGTLATSKCEYYKIGNLVYVYIMLGLGGTVTSGRVCSVTLPFTSASTYKLPIGIQSQSLAIDTSLGSGAYISDNKVYFTPTTGGSGSFVICITGMYPVSE